MILIVCVLWEPQLKPKFLQTLYSGTDTENYIIDIIWNWEKSLNNISVSLT